MGTARLMGPGFAVLMAAISVFGEGQALSLALPEAAFDAMFFGVFMGWAMAFVSPEWSVPGRAAPTTRTESKRWATGCGL